MFATLPFPIAALLAIAIALFWAGLIGVPAYLIWRGKVPSLGAFLAKDAATDKTNDKTNDHSAILATLRRINHTAGVYGCWLVLWMALVQFVVVVMRYVFAIGSIQMQESIMYLHGVLFLLVAGATYLNGGHVRVDIFYAKMNARARAWVNLLGAVFLLIPLLAATGYFAWPYVVHSWEILESSPEGLGLPFLYLLKTTILVFVALMAIQTAVVIGENALIIRTKPPTN